jgi:hypothetical protein
MSYYKAKCLVEIWWRFDLDQRKQAGYEFWEKAGPLDDLKKINKLLFFSF